MYHPRTYLFLYTLAPPFLFLHAPVLRRALPGASLASMKELFQYAATTQGVTVRVAVNFLPDHIRIENDSDQILQLLTRHWRITDGAGVVTHVDGEGVVGEKPVLHPGQSHDYVSGCPLTTPHGSMEGHYVFLREDGAEQLVAIPFFALSAPATAG